MFLRHLVRRPNVKSLQPCHRCLAKHLRLAAVEEQRLNHRLVELGADLWGNVLCSRDIADSRPGGTGFANLHMNCLYIVVVLGEKTPEILEDIDPLEHLVVDG
jgi:hypothetical protein